MDADGYRLAVMIGWVGPAAADCRWHRAALEAVARQLEVILVDADEVRCASDVKRVGALRRTVRRKIQFPVLRERESRRRIRWRGLAIAGASNAADPRSEHGDQTSRLGA